MPIRETTVIEHERRVINISRFGIGIGSIYIMIAS
jgi:hypothetical protein